MSLPRRSRLERGPGPARRTPLTNRAPLARGGPTGQRAQTPRAPRSPAKPARTGHADPLPADVRVAVYQRAEDRCEICGVPLRAGWRSVQHRARRGSGGSRDSGRHRLSNLLAVCGPDSSAGCHARADGASERYDLGWQVRRGGNPAAEPVLYRGVRVLLEDDGGIWPAVVAA